MKELLIDEKYTTLTEQELQELNGGFVITGGMVVGAVTLFGAGWAAGRYFKGLS